MASISGMSLERRSVKPGDPVLLRRALVRLRPRSSSSFSCTELAKEALEPCWRDHGQEATRSWHTPSVRVRYVPRREHHRARAGGKLLLPYREQMLPLDHVEELILIRVDVQRRVERIDLLNDREGTCRASGARLDEEHRARERQTLTGGHVEAVSRWALIGDASL